MQECIQERNPTCVSVAARYDRSPHQTWRYTNWSNSPSATLAHLQGTEEFILARDHTNVLLLIVRRPLPDEPRSRDTKTNMKEVWSRLRPRPMPSYPMLGSSPLRDRTTTLMRDPQPEIRVLRPDSDSWQCLLRMISNHNCKIWVGNKFQTSVILVRMGQFHLI